MSNTLQAAITSSQESWSTANITNTQALAALALAEEARLANLISIWQDPSLAPADLNGEFRANVRSQILEALRA